MEEISKENPVTGAVALIRALIAEGTDTVFGYPGGQVLPVYDALYDYTDSLKHILVRHEQGAAHAAEGYARATGRAGVVIVTSGPGATNVITGLSDAMMDSTPLVVITGQVGTQYLGSDGEPRISTMPSHGHSSLRAAADRVPSYSIYRAMPRLVW